MEETSGKGGVGPAGRPGKIVLVVDDSDMMREVIGAAVRQAGHQPLVAASGDDALDMIKSWNPRLVLLDVLMPGKSGMDTLRELRAMPGQQKTPVVLLTQVKDAAVIREAGKFGVTDYLSKPTTTEKLKAKLDKFLG
jgi:CheY-like chemotaxis protein